MNRITLNLASRPFRNNTIVATVLAVVAAALIAGTVYNVQVFLNYGGRYQQLQQEEKRHRDRLAALESQERSDAKEIQARDFKRLWGRGQFAADLIVRRAFSWTLLFNRLEDVVPPEVMMTAIRPHITGEKIDIRVDGIAKNHGALISLEELLQKNPAFAKVYPASERRLNPSRPEISFAVNFDYLPAQAAPPGPDAIASGAAPGQSPTPAPGETPSSAQAEGTPAVPTPTPATVASGGHPSAAPGKTTEREPALLAGTVGRDGQIRTPELLARVVAAPGGVYPATPPALPASGEAKKSKGKGRGARSAPAAGTAGVSGGEPKSEAKGSGALGNVATSSGAPSTSATLLDGGQTPPSPSSQAGLPPLRGARASGASRARKDRGGKPRPVEPVPATRLDVPLRFSGRPVGDVYAALSKAHGVWFEIDPNVDQRAQVTADLAGKSLKDAIALLSKVAGHKVQRLADGHYHVAQLAGGEPIADRPVQEESLPASEGKP